MCSAAQDIVSDISAPATPRGSPPLRAPAVRVCAHGGAEVGKTEGKKEVLILGQDSHPREVSGSDEAPPFAKAYSKVTIVWVITIIFLVTFICKFWMMLYAYKKPA